MRAALIHGRDRSAVRERADAVAARCVPDVDDPFVVGLLPEAACDDPARIADELAALSLTGGARLVRLRVPADKPLAERAAADALKAHLVGGGDAFFLIEATALGKDSALRRAAESARNGACIPVYDDESVDVARRVRERLAHDGVSLTPEALEAFVARLPHDRGVVSGEIERLALFLGPGSGTVGDLDLIAAHLGLGGDASLSEAAAHAAGAGAGPALQALRHALAEGESGVAAVRAAGQHLARLRRISVLVQSGTSPQAAAKSAGVFWKAEREFLRQHRAWSPSALDRGQAEVVDADRACKTAGSPDHLLAERLFLRLASQARRLGL